MAAINFLERNFEQAEYHQQRGLTLNPNYDLIVVQNGELYTWTGRADEGAEWILKAMRLNPFHPERFWSHLGRAYFVARRYEEAIDAFKRIARPDIGQKSFIAACHGALDREDKAKTMADEVIEMEPKFSSSDFVEALPYRDEPDRPHHRDALIKAGLPE
jgi:adenylate cyclase